MSMVFTSITTLDSDLPPYLLVQLNSDRASAYSTTPMTDRQAAHTLEDDIHVLDI